jgi:hypothetical protein
MKQFCVLLFAISALHAETLNYGVSWASGLSLGEASIDFSGNLKSNLTLDVGVPGFVVKDHYTSTADVNFCSATLDKSMSHGSRKSEERVRFDQQKQTATRKTVGGGESTINTSACARDPLTLLQFVRKELAEGRLAPQQAVVFGAVYQVRFEYAGVQQLMIGEKHTEAERIQTTVKGPASELTFDLFFARDAGRTPVMARIPSPLGAFVVELMR